MKRQPISRLFRVPFSGFDLINSPRLNKGTAFSEHERDVFDLHGLLPPHVGTLDEQLGRPIQALEAQPTPFAKYSFLRDLQDMNETPFLCSGGSQCATDAASGVHAYRGRGLPAIQRNIEKAARTVSQLSRQTPDCPDPQSFPLRQCEMHRGQRWRTNPWPRRPGRPLGRMIAEAVGKQAMQDGRHKWLMRLR